MTCMTRCRQVISESKSFGFQQVILIHMEDNARLWRQAVLENGADNEVVRNVAGAVIAPDIPVLFVLWWMLG